MRRWLTALVFLVGLGVAVGLILAQGVGAVAAQLATLGWGFAGVCAVHSLPIAATALAWRSLLVSQGVRAPARVLLALRWIGDAINALLPVAQIGGEIVRGRLLARRCHDGAVVAASIGIDMTAALVSLLAFVAVGVSFAASHTVERLPTVALLVGVGVLAGMLVALLTVQSSGLLSRLGRRVETAAAERPRLLDVAGGAAALDDALRRLRQARKAVVRCVLWRFAGWTLGAVEIWVALRLMGQPVHLLDAVALEAIAQAARNAGFFVPAGIGVQEGGYLVGAAVVGVPPDAALALAVVKRARDVVLGIPALGVWVLWENGNFRSQKREGGSPDAEK